MAENNWVDTLPDSVWGNKKEASVTPIGSTTTTPQQYYSQGMGELSKQASGTSSIFGTLENRANQSWGGGALAAMGSAKQEAAQAGYSPEAIGSIAQTETRELEGQRSTLMGDIAAQKQSLATTAAQNLVSGGLSGQSQQLAERSQAFSEKATKRSQSLTEKTAADSQKQTDWERMLSTYDASTPEGLSALQDAYTKLFGGTAPDLNTIRQQQEYTKTKQQQDVAMGSTQVTAAEQALKDQQQASVMSRIASGYNVDRINSELGTNLTPEEYDQMRQNTETYFTSKGIDMQEASLYGYTDESGNHVSGSLEIAAGQFGLQGQSFEEQKKELWGWTDSTGKTYAGKYDLLSAEDKRAADAMYGYDVKDSKGNVVGKVKGTLELQNDASAIQAQGLELEEAQIKGYLGSNGEWIKGSVQLAAEKTGMEVSSLYGYTYNSETGEVVTDPAAIAKLGSKAVKVDGALVLAQKQYGLQEGAFETQYAEMFGKDYETGEAITGADGKPVSGKIDILSSENKRAAESLYGYTETLADGTEVKHSGSLQIMEDELAIKKQGLSIEEAQFYGYDKTDENGNKVHVQGTLEIESRKMDLLETEYADQQNSVAGVALSSHFALMKNTDDYNPAADKQAQSLLQQYWESIPGNAGTTYDEDWAQRQYEASTVSESDAAIKTLESSDWYKDLQKTNRKQADQIMQVAKVSAYLSITQGTTPIYDEEGAVVGIQDSEGNDIYTVATEAQTKDTAEAWSDFMGSIPEGDNVTKASWEAAGRPDEYDKYTKTASPTAAIANLEVESSSELLDANNSKVVFEAYKKDPAAVKGSEYYFEVPDTSFLLANVSSSKSTTGIHKVNVTQAFKDTVSNNTGKIVELTGRDGKNYAGQLVGYYSTPRTIGYTIKQADGKTVQVRIGDF